MSVATHLRPMWRRATKIARPVQSRERRDSWSVQLPVRRADKFRGLVTACSGWMSKPKTRGRAPKVSGAPSAARLSQMVVCGIRGFPHTSHDAVGVSETALEKA